MGFFPVGFLVPARIRPPRDLRRALAVPTRWSSSTTTTTTKTTKVTTDSHSHSHSHSIIPVIGLEMHVQLLTPHKLFSPAPSPTFPSSSSSSSSPSHHPIYHNTNHIRALQASSAFPPNMAVSPFDVALPGTLPMLNPDCVRLAVKAGLVLGGDVQVHPSITGRRRRRRPRDKVIIIIIT